MYRMTAGSLDMCGQSWQATCQIKRNETINGHESAPMHGLFPRQVMESWCNSWSVARPPAPRRAAVIKSNSIDRRCLNTRWSSGVKSGERDWPHSVTTERAPESWKTKRCACSTGRDKVKVTTEQGCVLSVIHPDGAKSDWASSWVISTLAAREQRTEMSVQWNLDAKCRATAAHPARQISRCARRCSSDAQSLTKGSAESTIASNLAKSVIVMSWHLEAKMANGINGTASEPGTVEQKSVLKIEMGNATDKC